MSSMSVRQRRGARPPIVQWSSLFLTLLAIGSIPSLFADIQSDEPLREIAATKVPNFISQGGDIVAKENATVHLKCDTDFESKEYVLMWKFNNRFVLSADKTPIQQKRGVSFNQQTREITIEGLSNDHVGEYKCEISDSNPKFIVYNVSMATAPVIFQLPPIGKITVAKGEPLKLQCSTKPSPLPVTFKWIQNSKLIDLNSSVFTKNHVKPEDSGEYTCIAINEIGEKRFTFVVTVNYPPEISLSDIIVHGAIGNDVKVECDVNAYPRAKISWYFGNNSMIRSSPKHEIKMLEKSSILTIKDVSSSDYGSYYCLANNSQGDRHFPFEVTGKPSEPKFISPLVGNNLENYFLEWTVDSQSPIASYKLEIRPVDPVSQQPFEWRPIIFEAQPDQGPHHKHSRLLENLSRHNNYEVKLQVENEFGKTESKTFAFATAEYNSASSKTYGCTMAILLISLAYLLR